MAKTQIIELASKGLPYQDTKLGASFIDGHSVAIRPYNAGDQKDAVLKSKNTYIYLRQLFYTLVEQPKLDEFDEILTGDIVPVLVAVKAFTYGPNYSKKQLCLACEKVVEFDFKLNLFPLQTAVDVMEATDSDEFKTKGIQIQVEDELAGDKETFEITWHLPTLGDEKRLNERMLTLLAAKGKDRLIESDNPIDRSWVRMALLIDKINGDQLTIQDKLKFFRQRSTEFMGTINSACVKHNIGIVEGYETPCPNCGALNTVDLEVDHEFFRATPGANKAS